MQALIHSGTFQPALAAAPPKLGITSNLSARVCEQQSTSQQSVVLCLLRPSAPLCKHRPAGYGCTTAGEPEQATCADSIYVLGVLRPSGVSHDYLQSLCLGLRCTQICHHNNTIDGSIHSLVMLPSVCCKIRHLDVILKVNEPMCTGACDTKRRHILKCTVHVIFTYRHLASVFLFIFLLGWSCWDKRISVWD